MRIEQMTLYHYPTTRSARVKWLLHELGVENFDIVRIELFEGEHLRPEFLALNPCHAVPTLVICTTEGERLVMVESGAIVTLLADLYPEKGLAPPPSPVSIARADYLQTIHFCGAAVDMMLWQIRIHLHILPEAERHAATAERYRAKFTKEIEPQLRERLTGASYICGQAFSAADCMVGHAIMWARRYGLCEGPAFEAYLARLDERPAFHQGFADREAFRSKVPAEGQVSG